MKFLASFLLSLTLSACTLSDEYAADKPEGREVNFTASQSKAYMRAVPAGTIMTTPDGMTVYTYDNEAKGSASCYGSCAEDWPPVLAPADAKAFGDLATVKRIDGTRQWTFQGRPLHLYHDDKSPGDMKGDNKDGLWHVVANRK